MNTQNTPATAQHTPGPWKAYKISEPNFGVNTWGINGLHQCAGWNGRSDCLLATVYSVEANARLIAAAPDLLTSLRRLYEATYGRTDLVCQLDFEQARAAIAKAINA